MTTATLPSLIIHPHPLLGDGTTMQTAAFRPRETLACFIERIGAHIPAGPLWVLHNGRRVPGNLWPNLIPRDGDQVIIRAAVQGGGDGNKVLRSVAMIALVVAAITIPGAGIAGLYSGFGLTGTSLALATAGIMIGGQLVISPMLPEILP